MLGTNRYACNLISTAILALHFETSKRLAGWVRGLSSVQAWPSSRCVAGVITDASRFRRLVMCRQRPRPQKQGSLDR